MCIRDRNMVAYAALSQKHVGQQRLFEHLLHIAPGTDDHNLPLSFAEDVYKRQAVLSVSTNKYVILFLISLIILIAGVFMETSSAIIILTPVFLPLVRALGISTLHFGILFVVGIAIGMITPPVAINLFVASMCIRDRF